MAKQKTQPVISSPPENTKPWWLSKTLRLNVLGSAALILQQLSATWVIGPEAQAGLLALANTVLRLVTKSRLTIH